MLKEKLGKILTCVDTMKNIKFISTLMILSAALVLVGCQSSNTDTDAETYGDGIFIGSDENVGRIEIHVVDDSIGVSETTGFLVQLLDAVGQGVPGVRITCDTEADLALIEPTSGVFITGGTGEASGVLGCEDRGSFMLACRMPSGGKRKIVRVKCEGERPIGFTGFDGAGGGGLGNGVADIGNDDDDTNFSIRIVGLELTTVGGVDTAVDTIQGPDPCVGEDGAPGGGDDFPEPFSDDLIGFTVENNSEQLVRFSEYTYEIDDISGESDPISLIGEVVDGGATGSFSSLFLNNLGGTKNMHSAISLAALDGFKKVTFTLIGELTDGTPVSATASTTYSFGNFNNCE